MGEYQYYASMYKIEGNYDKMSRRGDYCVYSNKKKKNQAIICSLCRPIMLCPWHWQWIYSFS